VRRNFFRRLNKRDEFLCEDGVVEPARVGNAFSIAGEFLSEGARSDVAGLFVGEEFEGRVANVFLEEAAAFLQLLQGRIHTLL